MAYIDVPDQPTLIEQTLTTSTGKGDARIEDNFIAKIPKNLGSACALLGEKKVFRLFINAFIVELQAEVRARLQPKVEGKGRKKAAYLEALGL